ncbi:hypothetical protein DLM78_23555 [Leptospira stimsonii]|uniref:Uncharacterized protein n=1 Tax=Leptospira stimsonii TaxID=2202203 RepID=A0A8B3CK16_9LEPT|nr:hypothetical protein DLM78_23555 [Leptospira stimsonii]
MKESEYSELLVSHLVEFVSKLIECSFTSPPKSSTSPSKNATSLPLRLGKTGGSPGGRRPLTLAFCWGLGGVWKQNTHFTSKKGLLGPKKLSLTLFLFLLLLVGLES